MSARPSNNPKCSADFYLRPLERFSPDGVGFSCQPLGIHKIETAVNELCLQAGIEGRHSNHSLRATSVSRLYDAGVDEQLIQERTGHRSNAVCGYKRTSFKLQKKVTDTLCGGSTPNPPVATVSTPSAVVVDDLVPSVSPTQDSSDVTALRDTPEGQTLASALEDSNLMLREALCTWVCDLPTGLLSTICTFMKKFAGCKSTQSSAEGLSLNVHVHFH